MTKVDPVVREIEVVSRASPVFRGAEFGGSGPYERIDGVFHCQADPDHRLNLEIVNLGRAARNESGLVDYKVKFSILKPIDMARGNGWLIYDVVNRGAKCAVMRLNNAPGSEFPELPEHAGNGFLFREGFTILWTAWQGDAPEDDGKFRAEFPVAGTKDNPVTGINRDEIISDLAQSQFVTPLSYMPTEAGRRDATLTVRQKPHDEREPWDDWRWVADNEIEITRAPADRFDYGAIYEFIYEAQDPVVMGLGFAQVRDIVSFLRSDRLDGTGHRHPLHNGTEPQIQNAVITGISQSGRFVRDFLYQGFNADLDGKKVFDAAIPVIAGSRKTFVNAQFAQPGRFSRQHEDHFCPGDQFPFAYVTLTDPKTGRTDGILERCSKSNTRPKIIHFDTGSEIWSARSSLVVTDCEGRDLQQPDDVRVYIAPGLEHGRFGPMTPGIGQHAPHPIQYNSHYRAMLMHMVRWVEHNIPPPPSKHPTHAEGTWATPEELVAEFPPIPNCGFEGIYNDLCVVDHSVQPPKVLSEPYPVFVSKVDDDGNAVGGVIHPLIRAPLATYVGWKPRRPEFGGGELLGVAGSMFPFAINIDQRLSTGDPRSSLAERYGTRSVWLKQLEAALEACVSEGFYLQDDADALMDAAQQSFDFYAVT